MRATGQWYSYIAVSKKYIAAQWGTVPTMHYAMSCNRLHDAGLVT